MLLSVFKKGREKKKSLRSIGCMTITAPCLLQGGCSVPTEQTEVLQRLCLVHFQHRPRVALLTQATFSHGGGEGERERHKIPHEAQTPHNCWGVRTRHTTAFACNKYLPMGRAALSESFSTLRELLRLWGLLGGAHVAMHRSRAQSQEVPQRISPHLHSSDSPRQGLLTLK